MCICIWVCASCAVVTGFGSESVWDEHIESAKEGMDLFKSDVRQILSEHCLECHGGESTKAGVDPGSREALLESGYVGESADDSYLISDGADPAFRRAAYAVCRLCR